VNYHHRISSIKLADMDIRTYCSLDVVLLSILAVTLSKSQTSVSFLPRGRIDCKPDAWNILELFSAGTAKLYRLEFTAVPFQSYLMEKSFERLNITNSKKKVTRSVALYRGQYPVHQTLQGLPMSGFQLSRMG
jgi:hypothetical protein